MIENMVKPLHFVPSVECMRELTNDEAMIFSSAEEGLSYRFNPTTGQKCVVRITFYK